MIQRIPNPKILCCASIFALSLAACSQNAGKLKTENLADNDASASKSHVVKLKKGHSAKKLGLALPDPRSYDNIWDRLFDRFDLPAVDHPDVDRELNWFINHPAYIERVQSRAEPFLYSIVKQLEKQNMPGELALLPVIESAFQPHVVSPAHAAGIWQFIPATGRHYGLKQSYSYDGRRDIYASTRAAIKYLKKLHNDFNGDWLLAIAGYNCGEGAVSRAIQRNLVRGLPTDFWSLDLPQETRSYVPRLLAVAKLFSESEQYGFDLRPIPNKPLYKAVKMNHQIDLALAANAADIPLDKLMELNPGFKRQQVDLDGSYRLFIPAHRKTVDFKEELARQIAAVQGYSDGAAPLDSNSADSNGVSSSPSDDGVRTSTSSRRRGIAATFIAMPPAPAEPVEQAAAEPPAPAPEPVEQATAEPPAPAPEPVEQATAVEPPAPKTAPKITAAEPPVEQQQPASAEAFTAEPVMQSEKADPPEQAIATSDVLSDDIPEWSPRHRPRRSFSDATQAYTQQAADDEERSIAAAKPRPATKAPAKTVEKARREPQAAIEREKPARREPVPVREESAPSPRNFHKTAWKGHDEPVERFHQAEPEPEPVVGKKAAYVIKEGDTAYSIARRYGMDVDDLKKMNHIAHADDIKWGQSVTVVDKEADKKTAAAKGKAGKLSSAPSKYTARDGETLFSISRRFNVTVADLRKWNGIKEDRQFRAGMNITVSGEKD